jgi:hypothetical protein
MFHLLNNELYSNVCQTYKKIGIGTSKNVHHNVLLPTFSSFGTFIFNFFHNHYFIIVPFVHFDKHKDNNNLV